MFRDEKVLLPKLSSQKISIKSLPACKQKEFLQKVMEGHSNLIKIYPIITKYYLHKIKSHRSWMYLQVKNTHNTGVDRLSKDVNVCSKTLLTLYNNYEVQIWLKLFNLVTRIFHFLINRDSSHNLEEIYWRYSPNKNKKNELLAIRSSIRVFL